MCYALVAGGMATLNELDSVYGTEDAHDLYEIMAVKITNERILSKG